MEKAAGPFLGGSLRQVIRKVRAEVALGCILKMGEVCCEGEGEAVQRLSHVQLGSFWPLFLSAFLLGLQGGAFAFFFF